MRIKSEQKINQYINETELKSLMIRINNKTFLLNLSKSFLRLHKYKNKFKETTNIHLKLILEKAIVNLYNNIIKNKSKQLLLISDEELLKIKQLIVDYNEIYNDITLKTDEWDSKKDKAFNAINNAFKDVNEEMDIKNVLLQYSKKSDTARINKYIKKHTKTKSKKLKKILKDRIITISERNIIDTESYERFGELVLLIIKNILKKPKFSGYTYRDEFYSDSTDKIFRYLKNFNHKLISKITGQQVNAFSYLSQYVHNSILFIINTKKAEKQEVENYVNTYNEKIKLLFNETSYAKEELERIIELESIKINLYTDILNEIETQNITDKRIKVIYPEDYKISLEEYNKLTKLKELLGKECSVIRKRN